MSYDLLVQVAKITIPRLLTRLANQTWRRNSYGNLELDEQRRQVSLRTFVTCVHAQKTKPWIK